VESADGNTRSNDASGPESHASTAPVGEGVPSFDELYREYAQRTLNLLFRFTQREQVARDLLQDVFIKVYENMDSFEKRSQIYTWIYRIAVNHAINFIRRERRTLWFDMLDETVGELLRREKVEVSGLGGGDSPTPDEVLQHSETDRVVQQAIDSLPDKYRVPFILFKDENLSYAKIAEVMELSVSAVETRIHRARKMLIGKLTPYFK
jgi:RNA polymerase sigma-70 factor (ECF subfamily)